MCSIIGYMGRRQAAPLLVDGLKRMEYRGYDSAGVATLTSGEIRIRKGIGKVAEVNNLERLDTLPGNIGIGHTRWATHGGVSDVNAHPHSSSSNQIAIVHNGIIDNYSELKDELISSGYAFKSETDSEVIANLLQKNLDRTHNLKDTMISTLSQLKGKYAFISMFADGSLTAARFHEPLIIGIGTDSYFVSSDILGFVNNTDQVVYLDDSEFAILGQKGVSILDFGGRPTKHELTKVSKEFADIGKRDFVHYTLKEIFEQSETVTRSGSTTELEIDWVAEALKRPKKVYITGSGTSFNAALVGKYLLSKYAKINVEPIVSSEAQFSPVYFDTNSLLIALSQSGESADVLETASLAKNSGAEVVSIVNVMTSSLARMSSISIGLNCGPEIGVAATKSFTSQLAILYSLADKCSNGKLRIDFDEVAAQMHRVLMGQSNVIEIAREIRRISDVYILGKGIHYFLSMEASLKLKELPYIHAESLPGGELKHGPLALLDSNSYVIALNPYDSTYESMAATIHEVKARGAKIIGISNVPNPSYDYWISLPQMEEVLYPLVEIIPIQLLAYYSALERNANPDYPRNLAKSVTVK
ncbi:MAG: glutamine--fructose-6-phosphate transaminase (isomerizing) [Thaumarchaeota archaeon]|nr:glutamine--fructose-6-phosphate transaminase (isomerizing) [Nitrososphaerota archaeon]